MKHFLPFAAAVLLSTFSMTLHAQNNKARQVSNKVKQSEKGTEAALPYTAFYSSSFGSGNSAYSRLVLNAWNDFDNNTLENSKDIFADTVLVMLADGTSIKGKENVLKTVKEYRNSFSSIKTNVGAWTVLKPSEHPEDVVCIWGNETVSKADGTSDTNAVHEIWFFNKDGKVHLMRQFIQKLPSRAK